MAGLAQYSEYFENPLFTETIREVPIEKAYIGERFLPTEETFDIDFHETVFERQEDMANLVDSGAELPLTDRDPVRRVSGSITDMGQSYVVTKKELQALLDKGNAARRLIAEKQLLNKAATVRRNIDARIEWMRWQPLGTGSLTYAGPGGIQLGVDFGVDFQKTAGTRWDDTDPTILANYESWVQDYVDANGQVPDTYVTSLKVIRTVLSDSAVRTAITGESSRLLTMQELNDFLVGRELPAMEAFDTKVTYRDPSNGGTRTQQRLLSEKKGIFLSSGIGTQLLGPTVENDMNPGVFAHSFTQQRPRREVVEVVAAGFPKIMEPDLIGITNVLL